MTTTPKTLTVTESHRLLDALLCKEGTKKQFRRGIRNYTMALLMLDAGLRVGELVKVPFICLWVYGQPTAHLWIPAFYAKNKRERTIPLSTRIRGTLKEMYKYYWSAIDEVEKNFAFFQTDPTKSMTTRQVERFIRRAAMVSLGRPIHPHVLRHTFASRLMRRVNARIVQELLGHEHLSTTQIYTHPNQDDLTKAITLLGQGDMETGLPADPSSS